jgi:D-glucosaminate-6-phosphate ammonia-lyase
MRGFTNSRIYKEQIMDADRGLKIYEELGLRPVINCSGFHLTVLGGSILSPMVRQAMEDANRYYVDMQEMIHKTGHIIAEMVSAEAAFVTAGCSSAMVLAVAACMAGKDPEKAARLPDASGMKDQIIIQSGQRYKYDRTLLNPGAKLVEVGDEAGTSAADIEAAIGEKTVAIHFVAPDGQDGIVPLEEVLRIGKQYNIPVIVDAAGQVYPLENMRKYQVMGADLIAYSSKYFGGPNSAGFLAGRKEMVEAAMMHSFIGFEYGPPRTIGRSMKLDRQEVVAVVTALREWIGMDHQARFARYRKRAERLKEALAGIPNVEASLYGDPVTGVRITLDVGVVRKTTAEIADELKAGNPSIWFHWDLSMYFEHQATNSMVFSIGTIMDGDELIVAERLRSVLIGS